MEAGERDFLIKTILERHKDASAIALYGSRAAGYARKDSDYDVLVVKENHTPKITYDYFDSESKEIALLVVDRKTLEKDASMGILGEFAVGRLLNPYEPLLGEEFIREMERTYKRRATKETVDSMLFNLGELSYDVLVPPEYFLFETQRRRSAAWPPLKYSVSKTYTCRNSQKNLSASMRVFHEILKELEAEGCVSIDGKHAKIDKNYTKGRLDGLLHLAKLSSRAAMSYLTLAWSGRNTLGKLPKELISKLTRVKNVHEIPSYINDPKDMLRLEEGVLVTKGDWLSRIAKSLGYERFSYESEHLGDIYSTVYSYTVRDGEKSNKFVVKRYKDIRQLKWVLSNMWSWYMRIYKTDPTDRLSQEYRTAVELKKAGIKTPNVYGVDLRDKTLIMEFIEGGKDTGKIVSDVFSGEEKDLYAINLYGETLGKVHNLGYSIADTKRGNAILKDNDIYLVDLEQTARGGDQSCDIASFLYWSSVLSVKHDAMRKITREFIRGYLKHGRKDVVEGALGIKYQLPFQLATLPTMVMTIKDEIRHQIGK